MPDRPRHAALSLVRRPSDGRVLAISRGRDTRNWGLPGGGVELGESLEQAARRELYEETGVEAGSSARAHKIFEAPSRTSHATVFCYHGTLWVPDELSSVPFEGYVTWLTPAQFLAPSCIYREYTRKLFEHTGII